MPRPIPRSPAILLARDRAPPGHLQADTCVADATGGALWKQIMLHLYLPERHGPRWPSRALSQSPPPSGGWQDESAAGHRTGPTGTRQARPFEGTRPLTAIGRGLVWMLPWQSSRARGRDPYPGRARGMVRLLGGAAALRTIQDWMVGRHPPPTWAVERVLRAVEARVRGGAEIAQELRAQLERQRLGIEQQQRGGAIGRAMAARQDGFERGERVLGGPGK